MSVSGVSGSSSASQASAAETRAILVARKQQELDKTEAQALLDLVKQSTETVGTRLNVYA